MDQVALVTSKIRQKQRLYFAGERVLALREKWRYVVTHNLTDVPWDAIMASKSYGCLPIEYVSIATLRKRIAKHVLKGKDWSQEDIDGDIESHQEFLLEYWTGQAVRDKLLGLSPKGGLRGLHYYGKGSHQALPSVDLQMTEEKAMSLVRAGTPYTGFSHQPDGFTGQYSNAMGA